MRDVGILARITRELPKTDLHLHLDGSVRPQTLVALAKGTDKPVDLATAMRRMRVSAESRSLPDYLAKFPFTNGYLQTPAALERVTKELLEDCAAEKVKIAEV